MKLKSQLQPKQQKGILNCEIMIYQLSIGMSILNQLLFGFNKLTM